MVSSADDGTMFALFDRLRSKRPSQQTQVVDYRLMMEHSLDMICHAQVSPSGIRYLYASPATPDVLGWSCEEFLKLTPADIFAPESLAAIAKNVQKTRDGAETISAIVEAIRKDGKRIWIESKVRVLEKQNDGCITTVVVMRDITERKLLQDRLAQQAVTDSLTAIGNRRAFDEAIACEWSRTLSTGCPLSLILADLDCFKLLNDTYGHQAGDDCLRAVAQLAKGVAEAQGGIAARFGGEEFVILLPSRSLEQAEAAANRLRRRYTLSAFQMLGTWHARVS